MPASDTHQDHGADRLRPTAWATLLVLLLLAGHALVLARVVQLKLSPDPRLADAAGSPVSRRSELARRGRLLDRRGRVVATSTTGYRLFVDPQAAADPMDMADQLATTINADPIRIQRQIAARPGSRYVVVDALLESWQVGAVRTAGIAGVGLDPRLVRQYPHGDVGRRIVGLVGRDHNGLSGLEFVFEQRLGESTGRLSYLRDARRRPMWVNPEDYQRSMPGADVRLSIDLIIQDVAERHLADAVKRHNSGGGRLVVLDCVTGEILAMTDVLQSRPGWEEQTTDPAREIDPALARNRCITDPYEPGSTFKPFVWAGATELGKARLDEVLPTPAGGGHRTSRGRRIRDSHYYENADWLTVLTKSINSGMAIVSERMTHREMQSLVDRYGFGRRTNCRLVGQSPGIVTTPAEWSHYTQTSVAMGHEIAVTPLQMVRAFSVFARDGTMPMLRITTVGPGEPLVPFVQRVISEPLARTVRGALRSVVLTGTGQRAQSDLYQLFGKSGTAQLPIRDGGGYHEDRYVSSFVAGAPYERPRIVVLCVIDDPDKQHGHYGGAIAGPVVRDVIDETLTYLGVAPDQPGAAPPSWAGNAPAATRVATSE
jgi:cell division protein FtsI/penicillin-binding protein 2